MKKSRSEAAETRRRIVEKASAEFRRSGIHSTGLCEVMAAAGLTHGGFYCHFDSKGQLIAEACEVGTESVVQMAEARISGIRCAACGKVLHIRFVTARVQLPEKDDDQIAMF